MSFRTPADPSSRSATDASDSLRPADHNTAVAAWLAHVEAGRIGRNPPTDPAIRERVLANHRLICGDGRLPIG